MRTEFLDATNAGTLNDAVGRAAELIARAEVVAFPTETVYGLGADAFNPAAIAKVFSAKGRPADNPLIVHVADIDSMMRCGSLGDDALLLADAFMPGPLTLVVPAHPAVPPIARAGLPGVALRMPAHPVAAALIALTGPLVAPSANRSGRPSPTTAEHVMADLEGAIAAVLDGGPCTIGIESTVVDLTNDVPAILRPGTIPAAALEAVLGRPLRSAGRGEEAPRAPGMKYRHYAPAVPVRLVIAPAPPPVAGPADRCMILTTARHAGLFPGCAVELLSERTLYALFREADRRGVAELLIYAEPGELDAGLLDRITKAAAG
ncbi:MAG TPA: L-threonylcarbamoyladenylate synthase [Candidatus Kapabacteria bacterium]|nr:L-threonylcarbamoyladenylate synthase [Candidatus Kapabacteria bacterium]